MIKIIKYLFFIFVLLFLTNSKVIAFEFVKNTNNPLNITYINDYAYPFQAHIYKEDNRCKGILTARKPSVAYYSLVAIESEDCVSWTMTKEILNINQDISNPRLFVNVDGSKKLFFTKTDGIDFYRIYSTDCDNNLNCSSAIKLVLNPNQSDLTEKNGYFASYIMVIDGHYYMFYGAWGNDGFKIRMAYSDNLESWQKCPNDLIFDGADGPFPYLKENNLYLFYHKSDSSGIKLAKTSLPLSCDSVFEDLGYLLRPGSSYDIRHLVFPSVIDDSSGLKLYYSGRDWNWNWSLNLACTEQACLFPTITPTITPIPTKTPIVIIPGFMASWNKQAILHNESVSQPEWKLTPFVKEYNGLINTLKNLNYEENKDLFIFSYDWRKPILEITGDLNEFLTSNHFPTTNFYIIGHSLGGLIARIYQQKYQDNHLEKAVTVASPHHGVTQVYKAIEGGEIDRWNDYLWLAEKSLIALNRNNLETDKQTINRIFPVLKDLFPIYNFLKEDGAEIATSEMKIKNELLSNESYKIHETNLINLFSLVGEKGPTLKGYDVVEQSFIDKLLENYPDGRPESSYNEIGDYLILSESARLNTPLVFNLDHGEIIYKKEAIKKILDLLDISYGDSQIMEGKSTKIDHSLVFLIKSPAEMEVIFDNQTYLEQNGVIFIENAESGNYQLNVKGNDIGTYEVIVGQTGETDDIWESIYGETSLNQTDLYNIHYNSDSPQSIVFDDLSAYLKIKGYQFDSLENLTKLYHDLIKNRDFIGLEKLENYEFRLNNQQGKINPEQINKELARIEEKLNNLKKPIDPVVLEQIVKRLDTVKEEFARENYHYCQILLETIERLLKVVKK